MKKNLAILAAAGLGVFLIGIFLFSAAHTRAAPTEPQPDRMVTVAPEPGPNYGDFDVQVMVDGRPLEEYAARGRTYVQAIEGAEYELRIRNPLPVRVAVALSVDGLNSIDARHTTAWEASKWVIGPYQTIHISGWQVSSERARHFYFTTERDSYGAKLGQTANLGVISAVFFSERHPTPVPVIVPPPRPPRPPYEEKQEDRGRGTEQQAAPSQSRSIAKD